MCRRWSRWELGRRRSKAQRRLGLMPARRKPFLQRQGWTNAIMIQCVRFNSDERSERESLDMNILLFSCSPCGSCMIPTLIPEMKSPRAFSLKGYRGSHDTIGTVPSRRFFTWGPDNLDEGQTAEEDGWGKEYRWVRWVGVELCNILALNRVAHWRWLKK